MSNEENLSKFHSSAYGNFDFKSDGFSNSHQMVGVLKHEEKFNVSAALTPFISVNTESRNFLRIYEIYDLSG
jgi:hypothetical protein